jgi:hypothetical protein
MDAGRSRVLVRRSVQALSGFVIRQRPRVGSRAVIPSPRCDVAIVGRSSKKLAADDPHRYHHRRLPRDCATLPLGSVAVEAKANEHGERYVWLEPAMADRLGAMRGPGEGYSDVILRIAGREGRKA